MGADPSYKAFELASKPNNLAFQITVQNQSGEKTFTTAVQRERCKQAMEARPESSRPRKPRSHPLMPHRQILSDIIRGHRPEIARG